MDDELNGKVALVTGGSRGIGRAVALALARNGADIVLNFHHQEQKAAEVCAAIRQLGPRALPVQADVSAAADVEQLFAQSQREMGEVSILVNNAGISRPQPLDKIRERDWDEVLTTNLKSMFLVTQAALPAMRKNRWGRIINLSSVAAQLGGVIGPHYAASKAGAIGLTHSYAGLLAKEGITVNAIAPALIETDMVAGLLSGAVEKIPVGRLGQVNEVAEVAVMLARNPYITGQTISVNGGWYMT